MVVGKSVHGEQSSTGKDYSLTCFSRGLGILNIAKSMALKKGNLHSQLPHIFGYNYLAWHYRPIYHSLGFAGFDFCQLGSHVGIVGPISFISYDLDL